MLSPRCCQPGHLLQPNVSAICAHGSSHLCSRQGNTEPDPKPERFSIPALPRASLALPAGTWLAPRDRTELKASRGFAAARKVAERQVLC